MRKGTGIVATLVLLVALDSAAPPAAATPLAANGYGAAFVGESAFPAVPAGASARLTVVYANTGSLPWLPGIVGLLVCAEDQITCGVPSPHAAYARNWFGPTVYATIASPVAPGQNAFFTYDITVPPGTPANVTAVFYGAVGLIETAAAIQLDGYYQANTTPTAAARGLRATFVADPIAADGRASTTLQVEVLGADGSIDTADDGTVVNIAEGGAALSVCELRLTQATVQHGRALFDVVATEQPGTCDIRAIDDHGTTAVATLTTRRPGTAFRLTVSGSDSPQVAGAAVTVAVDVDDVNIALVGGDSTTVVTMTLDPASCTGAPGGYVYVTSGGSVTAADGRAWFALRSNGAYGGCRVSVTSPGLRPTVTTVVFAAGPVDHLTCVFSPQLVDPGSTATASLEPRDVFGNLVQSVTPYGVTFARTSGNATTLVGEAAQVVAPGAAFFTVRAGAVAGVDRYTASLDGTAGPSCAITVHSSDQ